MDLLPSIRGNRRWHIDLKSATLALGMILSFAGLIILTLHLLPVLLLLGLGSFLTIRSRG